MQILEKYNKCKAKNKGHIVLMKQGAFYVAIGIDAYILNDVLGIKITNIPTVAKVGIPVISKKKYEDIMQHYDIPYVIIDDADSEECSKYDGNFNLVEKTEKMEHFLSIFHIKDNLLEFMIKYCKFGLGEIL